jgi:hypothetical protein
MTETVKAFPEYGPTFFPLAHPSWRSSIWMRRQPWFEKEVVPHLRKAVQRVILGGGARSQLRVNGRNTKINLS